MRASLETPISGVQPQRRTYYQPVFPGEPEPMRLGYLLPTREQIMEGRPDAASLLSLAERAASLGFDSIWAGDSLLARPRHEPLILLAAVAGRVPRVEI